MHSSEIRYFLAVANMGSLSAASQQLFVAVSAISRQIQKLETRIGVPLFERHARGMVLTDAGQILENHVRKSLMDMDYAIAEIQGLKAVRRTFVRVACTDGMAFDLLPGLFARFRQSTPSVTFHLVVGSAMQVSEMVRNGECDIALQFCLAPERGVEVIAVYPAPVLLLMRDEHPLARKKIHMEDLHEFPLALSHSGTTIRQLFDLSCRMSGTFLEPTLSCNNFSALYYFTLQTPNAITACSHFSVLYRARADNLTLKSVDSEQLGQRTLQVQTMAGKHRSVALSYFIDFLTEELRRESERFLRDVALNGC
ncbi:LysR family transcriptional regulator [Prodigiosinella confusarubida]|uniref:LysR family transcriptional regulator n=1 Tax=Serratia sp. (strain ATCC 39006) TaxID=104623 RepID=A0A2I5TAY6_SERS3|nr:LysR family transcriptional regulator [Serratia sp. ATCC 39006]AUH01748.1 LysR family transcriptional regulator [Serratia sp. ATCC 39006]AUH06071.1 LysR family transcriptional regulator [Serratia sp. ATCC 39006]